MMSQKSNILRSVLSFLLFASFASADVRYWTGAIDRNWHNSGNWSTLIVTSLNMAVVEYHVNQPIIDGGTVSEDTIIIGNDAVVTVDDPALIEATTISLSDYSVLFTSPGTEIVVDNLSLDNSTLYLDVSTCYAETIGFSNGGEIDTLNGHVFGVDVYVSDIHVDGNGFLSGLGYIFVSESTITIPAGSTLTVEASLTSEDECLITGEGTFELFNGVFVPLGNVDFDSDIILQDNSGSLWWIYGPAITTFYCNAISLEGMFLPWRRWVTGK